MKTRALAVVVVVLLGCPGTPAVDGGTGGGSTATGGGGGATGGGSGGLALADYCATQQASTCAKDIRCGAAAQGADCQKLALAWRGALLNARVDCLSASLRANITSGLTRFDGVKAQECLTALATTSECASLFSNVTPHPSCNEVFTGTVAQSGSCYGFNECAAGLFCDATERLCPGTCKPRVPAGGVTTTSLGCEVGLSSSFRADAGNVCVVPVAAGQSCTPPAGTFQGLPCAGANLCQASGDGGSTCLPMKTAGQACTVFAFVECALDTACAPGSDGGTQCVPLRRSGETCGVNLSCQAGLACVGGLCGPLVPASGSCGADGDCIAGHVCSAGACRPFGKLDAGCDIGTFRGDCGVGLFCNAAGHCETQRQLGALCTGNDCSWELGFTCNLSTDGGASSCQPGACTRP